MKRVVIFADDLEPITVIELEEAALGYLRDRGIVILPAWGSLATVPIIAELADAESYLCKTCAIRVERFVRRGRVHDFLFADDEETALLLKAAFLPGQLGEVRECERRAYGQGVLAALRALGAQRS